MASYVNSDTIRFYLFDVHQVEDLLSYDRFSDYDEDGIKILMDSVKDYSDQYLYPYFKEMDANPAHYKDGKIITHPKLGEMINKAAEMGLMGSTFDYESGGLQMPATVSNAAVFIMEAANNHVPGYMGLTAGAAELILEFANDELKEKYPPRMLSGEWGGTMCLTEPQAGSSLSDITTTAYPQEDGSYKIKGQKIFISGGDHEHCNNFVHLLLARIEGAPAGTRGISLFVVPKNRITASGDLEFNDVITGGDYQKMGQKGYCTTHLIFGENDDCQAWLVGKPHHGLKYMFQMMNGARIAVGRGAAAIACAAYHHSLQYAKERKQGRRVTNTGKKDVNQEPVLILEHADVRRMLFLQKAIYEGSLSLILETSRYYDLMHATEGEEKAMYNLLLEILTPITKTYPSDKGREAVDNGLQVLGGYGFCEDFILQQYYRDIRISAIYEGTTGIQSMDLLGRKITMDNGKALQLLMKEVQQTIEKSLTYEELQPYAKVLAEQVSLVKQVLDFLIPFALKGEHERYLSDASIFMELFSTIVIAWQWLKTATKAKEAIVTGKSDFKMEFYESKIKTMKFYFKYEVPRTNGLAQILTNKEVLTIFESNDKLQFVE